MGQKRASLVAAVILVVFFAAPSSAHVALTYPPARKYDLDFLDSSRTKAPCGMPKGDIKTSLLSGSKLNVTWHLGYPHKGGFQLQLLDELERPVLDLTPTNQGSPFVSRDPTAQSFEAQLPTNFSCANCTLRLIRQATEWGANYKFWSCADVDIKERKQYRDVCSGHGRSLVGRCKCNRLYYGTHCQFREECFEDSDCGDHGKCIDIEATTAPKQQCYCQMGWFGPGCNKRSPVRTTDIDFGIYNKRKLSDTFVLYWRILKEQKEIEAVMVVNGTSYAGLGWRPRSLTSSCKNFPQIGPIGKPSDPKLEAKAEPEPTSEPEPDSTPEPEAEPKSEPTAEPETTTTTDNPKKSLYNRRSAAPSNANFEIPDGTVETSVSFQVSRKQGRRKRDINEEPVAEPTSEPESTQGHEASPEPTSEPTSRPEPEPTTDPKSEPVPASEPEPTPEPKSEPEPTAEPKSETHESTNTDFELIPTAKPEPNAEPEPNSKPEPGSVPEPEPKTHANLEAAPVGKEDTPAEPLHPYTPRHDFNAMDCTDIIIGSARNTASRIADYYTRDRSTPRMDNFWGGKNDLTAAMGFEKDGVTTILFRKKLHAKEPSDHSIEDELMHVIWAQGQEKGKYVHVPKSGVETANAKVKDFYKPDELKYHGHGSQRGVTTINFLEEAKKVVVVGAPGEDVETPIETSFCSGEWKFPRSCSSENYTCEYSAKWNYKPRKDELHFTITTNHTDAWTGIAFSKDEKMSQTDAILGWVDKTGRPFLMDTWISGYTQPLLDSSQGIYNTSGRIVDGVTTLSFTRKRISTDPRDLSFTNDECLFMMFPVKGGIFNSVNKKIRKHEVVPTISSERICIKSCGNDEDLLDAFTTQEPPGIGFSVKVKIIDLGENFHPPKPGTVEYEDLSNTINDNFKPVFNKIPGYKKLTVENLEEQKNDVIAILNLQLDKAVVEKGRALSEEEDHDQQIQKLVRDSLVTGRIGALKVDPSFLAFDSQSITTNIISDSEQVEASFFKLSEAKLYIVLGCIAALVLVAIVQASCTIYKASTKSSSSHKDHLIPNSAWKDYSAANTNYAFDTYEADEKKHQTNGKSRSETLPPKNRPTRPTTRPPSIPQQPGGYMGDTRSLQRPRGGYPPGSLERSTFSLPRTAYERHRPQQDMQPDFYFMPSQRKYSGEVVRVYVDYNNQPK